MLLDLKGLFKEDLISSTFPEIFTCMHVRNALNESVIIKKLFLSFLKPFHDFDQHFQISSTKDMC